jgi:putative transposase
LRLVTRALEGAKRALEKFGTVEVSTLRADFPMDILQIDHTLADVIVVDREQRLPIGQPCLRLAIDLASRAVVGFKAVP